MKEGDAWEALGHAISTYRQLAFDSLDDIAPDHGFFTEDGTFVDPADVVVRGMVVDVEPARAWVTPPDPEAASDQEVLYEAAPPTAVKVVRLLVHVDEVVAGALPEGVTNQVGVEVVQPIWLTIDELRAMLTNQASGFYFLRKLQAFYDMAGRTPVAPAPPSTYQIMADVLFVDDGTGGIKAPYLSDGKVDILLGQTQRMDDLLQQVRQY